MSFQKCPICNGTGLSPFPNMYSSSTTSPCPTCNGHRIIDDKTGLPPTQNSTQNVSDIQTGESQIREPESE